MKVWEKINEIQESSETMEHMKDWACSNRICPMEFCNAYELEPKYCREIKAVAKQICNRSKACEYECIITFLNSDISENTKKVSPEFQILTREETELLQALQQCGAYSVQCIFCIHQWFVKREDGTVMAAFEEDVFTINKESKFNIKELLAKST